MAPGINSKETHGAWRPACRSIRIRPIWSIYRSSRSMDRGAEIKLNHALINYPKGVKIAVRDDEGRLFSRRGKKEKAAAATPWTEEEHAVATPDSVFALFKAACARGRGRAWRVAAGGGRRREGAAARARLARRHTWRARGGGGDVARAGRSQLRWGAGPVSASTRLIRRAKSGGGGANHFELADGDRLAARDFD
jgi:hypothetical protein